MQESIDRVQAAESTRPGAHQGVNRIGCKAEPGAVSLVVVPTQPRMACADAHAAEAIGLRGESSVRPHIPWIKPERQNGALTWASVEPRNSPRHPQRILT